VGPSRIGNALNEKSDRYTDHPTKTIQNPTLNNIPTNDQFQPTTRHRNQNRTLLPHTYIFNLKKATANMRHISKSINHQTNSCGVYTIYFNRHPPEYATQHTMSIRFIVDTLNESQI